MDTVLVARRHLACNFGINGSLKRSGTSRKLKHTEIIHQLRMVCLHLNFRRSQEIDLHANRRLSVI